MREIKEQQAKAELHRLVDVLSDYECTQLLRTVRGVAEGDRFWEGDCGHFYNEYVKTRYVATNRTSPNAPKTDAFVPLPLIKSYPNIDRVPLLMAEPLDSTVGDALLHRRSRRKYADTPLTLLQLSTLLHHAAGVTTVVPAYGLPALPLRSFPSHGGLQSPELYLAVRAVTDLPSGLYHYHSLDHVLERFASGDHAARLRQFTFDEEYIERAAVVLLVTGYYARLRWKYGERAYRLMCLDAGFLSQNIYLTGEAMGLGVCAVSGFAQDAVEEMLEVDGKDEIALLCLTLGHVSKST
jgi:SagB-type dehydrogenase family enzyme